MRQITTLAELRHQVHSARGRGERIGFVPTMGALHEGHRALMRVAHAQCDFVVASVFVNPSQFSPGEDFDRYPRTPADDARMASAAGLHLLWLPDAAALYPPGSETRVTIGALGSRLCGEHREGHFEGVATVVVKLLGAVQPDVMYLGEKDFQQAAVLRRVVRDLLMPVEVRTVPTVRDPDGVALSSRNRYLKGDERVAARRLSAALAAASDAVANGERSIGRLLARTEVVLGDHALVRPQYAEIVDPETLEPADVLDRPLQLLVAAHVGDTRLIDNCTLVPCQRTLAEPAQQPAAVREHATMEER